MDKHIPPKQPPARRGSAQHARTTSASRRRQFEAELLRIKLLPIEERIKLCAELSERETLSSTERRQLLIAIQRYVMSGRIDRPKDISGLLATIGRLATRHDLRLMALKQYRSALEYLPRDEVIPQLQGPFEEIVKQLAPRSAHLGFSPELLIRAVRKLEDEPDLEGIINVTTIGLFFFPFDGPLREIRADVQMSVGNVNSALKDIELLVEEFPERIDYRLDRAEASLRIGEYDDALDDLGAVIRHEPENAVALRKKAECLFHRGSNFEALEVINELLAMEGDSVELLLHRARINEQLEFLDEAVQDAKKALTIEPDNQEARQLRQSVILRRQSLGMEDDLYTAFTRGDEEVFLGDLKIPEARFNDIGGLDEAKRLIRENIELPLKHPEVSAKYGKTAGGGLLFFGPPGCGKTLLARAAAGECGITLINVNLAHVLDKWVGNSEKAISMMFAAARKRAPSILFFDEVDAIGGSRATMQSGWEKKLISQLLIELDGLTSINENVMVMGATNAPWDVDYALRRPGRLGRLVFVPPPEAPGRADIFKIYLGQKPLVAEDIDFAELGRKSNHYSPDSIRQIVENAATIPWRRAIETGDADPISQQDLLSAIKQTPPDLTEWEKVVSKYEEFAKQSLKHSGVGFRKPGK